MLTPHQKAQISVDIVKNLWPHFVAANEEWDKFGIDGWIGQDSVQIKYDSRMAETGNVYHEYYKKTYGPGQKPAKQGWRHTPSAATHYVIVTKGFALMVSVDALAQAEAGKQLRWVLPTSMGFLVPLDKIRNFETRPHSYSLAPKE